jgi:DNA (cytosine-5)-methyltransferase 1
VRLLDLFSGIGGFSLGLERAGMQTMAFCEKNPFCREVLAKHWPSVPCYENVYELTGEIIEHDIGPIDIIAGGFPCQPYSVAGKQRGEDDDRDLWPQMRRLISEVRPRWVCGENVAGLIHLGLDRVLSDLDALGYAVQTFVIPACAVDAPQRRARLWILAHADGVGRDGQREPEHAELESTRRDEPDRRSKGRRRNGTAVADTDGTGCSQQRRSQSVPEKLPTAERSRNWNNGTTLHGRRVPQPGVRLLAYGIPRRVDQLRALGNAVVPQVVEEVGCAIMEAE